MSSSTNAAATAAVAADAVAADAAAAAAVAADAAADAAAANVSLPSSLSTDTIEDENPDVSVLNHEEQNQEMKDLLVFDLLGTKQKESLVLKAL